MLRCRFAVGEWVLRRWQREGVYSPAGGVSGIISRKIFEKCFEKCFEKISGFSGKYFRKDPEKISGFLRPFIKKSGSAKKISGFSLP